MSQKIWEYNSIEMCHKCAFHFHVQIEYMFLVRICFKRNSVQALEPIFLLNCVIPSLIIYIIVFYNCDLNYNVLQDADEIIQL